MKNDTLTRETNIRAMVNALERYGFSQGWYDGGPPFPPQTLTQPSALGRGRVAWFDNSMGVYGVKLDLLSGCWRICNDNFGVIRGFGYAQLIRALKTLKKEKS